MKLLGLAKKELLVLEMLSKCKSSRTSALARSLALPRTSVHDVLSDLKDRGLVERIKIKNHKEWRMISEDEAGKLLQRAATFLLPKKEVESILDTEVGVEIYRGNEGVVRAYEKMLSVGRGNRIYGLQGNKSATSLLKKVEISKFFPFHRELKRKGIILDVIVGPRVLELLDKMSEESLRSHLGRMMVTHLVPDKLMDLDIDILLFNNVAIIVHPDKERALVIRNYPILEALRALLLSLREEGKKIDINAYITKLLN